MAISLNSYSLKKIMDSKKIRVSDETLTHVLIVFSTNLNNSKK